MADENIVTNIVAKSDFSNLIADLHKVSYSLTSLQDKLIATNKTLASQVGVMNRSFAETLRSTGQYSTRFVSLTSDVDKFGSQLEKGQMKLSKFFNVYGQHAKTSGGLIRDLARQQVQLQNAIMQPLGKNAEGLMQYNVHIPRGLDAVKNKTAIARQELQIMNKVVQQGAGQLINWGKNTQWAGRQLTVGLTVPLVAFGKASADAFKQADEQLVRLTKVYGGVAQTSARDLAKIRADVSKTASDLAKSYGASFKDTLSLAADIAATGKQGDDLLGSLRETTRLSVLGEVDKQDAMKATLAIQSAFKQNTEELTESINFLNAVENQTSTTLNDLVEAIPKAGPIIKGLGGTIQDLALYLTAMREGGINASEGANALKSGLASLINPTKVAKGMFQDLGISLEDIVNKNAGNTTATILELQSALETLNPLQKQQALEQLFGKFQFARMNALFENLGKQGSQTLQVLDLMKASSQDLASLAGRELGQVTESASGKYRRAVEGLRADLAGIGDQFLTINANLINFVDGVLKFIQQLPGPVKQALGFFGMLTAVAGPLIMLTGVLGNFFGYIIKGAYHFKSLFKGGEGWKLLTPEILAAQKAGALVETTFYSDAKAAAVLKQSINELALSYANLQQKASMAATSTNPAVRTAGGNLIIPGGGQRQVDPNNPMTGKRDTRDFSHVNPVGQMTAAQKANQTIFGVVPGSEAVNARISNNPQMYMNKDMPQIPGLTTINGASTGIVAAEAAKWHSMTGALAMQSQAEIKLLKAEVAQTGLITHELSASYQALLPEMTRLTTLAATKSQAIVAQLQAGKINVDQAMVRIRALNFEIEAMMGQAATQIAAAQGRNINLTGVPLLNQAVVGPDGKSNFKELSRPGRTRGLLGSIARNLGVKTYGAGYSMETTIPKRLADGGRVFGGPRSDTTDTQFEYLPEGSFVLNRKASDALLGFNRGGMVPAMVTPGEILIENPTRDEADMLEAYNNQFAVGGTVTPSKYNYGLTSVLRGRKPGMGKGFETPKNRNRDQRVEVGSTGIHAKGPSAAQAIEASILNSRDPKLAEKVLSKYASEITRKDHTLSQTIQGKDFNLNSPLSKIWQKNNLGSLYTSGAITNATHATKARIARDGNRYVSRYTYQYDSYGNQRLKTGIPVKEFIGLNSKHKNKYDDLFKRTGVPKEKWKDLEDQIDQSISKEYGNSNRIISDDLPGTITLEDNFAPIVDNAILNSFGKDQVSGQRAKSVIKSLKVTDVLRSKKTVAQALNLGGMVGLSKSNYGVPSPAFKSQLLKRLGAVFGKSSSHGGYDVNALKLGMGSKLFGKTGLSANAQNVLYNEMVEATQGTAPNGYVNLPGNKLARGIMPDQTTGILMNAVATSRDSRLLTKRDKEILAKWDELGAHSGQNLPKWLVSKIQKNLFPFNQGGVVGGRVRSGKYNYGDKALGLPESNMAPSRYQGSMVAGMGLQTAGFMTGNSALMIGGTAMQMAPMLAPAVAKLENFKISLAGLGSLATKVSTIVARAFTFMTGPIGLTITAISLLVTGALKLKDRMTELGEANRLAFGGDKESFASVGIIKYKSLADRLKEVNEQIDLNKAKAQSAYEAYTKGGPTGITLSIAELSAAVENAKKNQTEYINAFNNIDSSGVNKYAADLKAQFIGMGLSASEASNQIYAMIKASEKAGQALSAVSTTDFRNIIDQTSALTRLFDNLGRASTVNNFDPEEFAVGLDTLINSVIAYQEGLVGTAESLGSKEMIDSAEALRITMEKITKIQSSAASLNTKQLQNLKEQNLVYASILSNSETLSSITAKILLYNSELGQIVNLQNMEAAKAVEMATNYAEVLNGVNKITEDISDNNPLRALAEPISKAKAAADGYKAIIKAAQKQDEDYYSNKIKAIDLEIKKIREAADARRKALQEQQDAESYNTEIKKLQLDYQNKLAAGDMAGAARAQLDIQQLSKEKQTRDAIEAINKKEAEDLKKKELEKQKIQDAEAKFKKGVSVATGKAAEIAIDAVSLEKNLDRLEKLSILYASTTDSGKKQGFAKEAQAIVFAMKSGTKDEKQAALDLEKQYGAPGLKQDSLNLYGPGQTTTGQKVLDAMKLQIEAKGLTDKVFGTAVTDFKLAVDKFKGNSNSGNGSKESPLAISKDYSSSVTTGGQFGRLSAKQLIKENNLKAGNYVNYLGTNYKVLEGNVLEPVKKAMGGHIRNYDTGSFGGVRGPGTGTSDSIPAYLSNGEYVLRASAVRAVGIPMLDEINKMAMGGLAARYDVGNKMSMPSSAMGYAGGGMIQHYNVGGLTINTQPGQSEMEIARMAVNMMNAQNSLSNTKTGRGLAV